MNRSSIHHIGIKVKSINDFASLAQILNIPITEIADHPEVGLKIGHIHFDNNIIELLEVTSDLSPLANDAYGVHHIGFLINDFSALYNLVSSNQEFMIVHDIFLNASGQKVFFFKMKRSSNVFFEFIEIPVSLLKRFL